MYKRQDVHTAGLQIRVIHGCEHGSLIVAGGLDSVLGALVLAVGGLGAAVNLADLQGAVTVQPIVRQQSGTEPEMCIRDRGKAVSKETKVDILVTPLVTIFVGVGLSILIAAPILSLIHILIFSSKFKRAFSFSSLIRLSLQRRAQENQVRRK